MEEMLKGIKFPGIVPILVLMFGTLFVAWELPEYAIYVPFLLAAVSYLINRYAPKDSALRELADMVKALIVLQPPVGRDVRLTRVEGPEGARLQGPSPVLMPRITETDVDKVVEKGERSTLSKILWGA